MDMFSDLDAMNVIIKIMEVFKHSSWNSVLCSVTCYEGWNFNSGNYLFTTDTK